MRTTVGDDWQSAQMAGVPGAAGKHMALTGNTVAPAKADTVLTGEFAAAGGGLIRVLAAYAHTAGSSSYSLSNTFTMNASDGSTATPAKLGIFTALTGGLLVFESAIPSPPAMVPSDSVAITETVNY